MILIKRAMRVNHDMLYFRVREDGTLLLNSLEEMESDSHASHIIELLGFKV